MDDLFLCKNKPKELVSAYLFMKFLFLKVYNSNVHSFQNALFNRLFLLVVGVYLCAVFGEHPLSKTQPKPSKTVKNRQ